MASEPTLLTLSAQLTQFVAGVLPPELIGREVSPPTPANIISDVIFNWWKIKPDEYLRNVVKKVNRRGTIPVTDFAFDDSNTATLSDYGQQIINPNDIRRFSEDQPPQVLQLPMNVRMAKLKAMTETFWFSHEDEVQSLLRTASNWSGAQTTNNRVAGASDMLDVADNNPIKVITGMIDTPLIPPNALIMPLAVYRPLQRHPQMIAAIKAVLGQRQAINGLATADEMAALFGLDQVIVPRQRTNTANPGQTATYARIWGRDLIALRIEPAPMTTVAPYAGTTLTAFGNIMNAGPVWVYSRNIQPGEENGGAYGAIADIIAHTRKALLVNPDSGYLLQNCVSADV